MKKLGVLALSALLAVLSLTLVVGGTYAIFSSDASTDIAVASGKVEVTADVKNIKMYSGEWDETLGAYKSVDVTANNAFTNGGTASFENGELVLDKISPMDRVEFDVEIKNESDINIKYRTFLKTGEAENDEQAAKQAELLEALKVSISDVEIEDGEFYSSWGIAKVGEGSSLVHIVIELPETAGNALQGLECKLIYGVEAIQGNAKTEEWVSDITYISSIEGLVNFANNVNSGNTYKNKKVKLIADIDLTGVEWTPIGANVTNYPGITFAGIFDGCGHTVSNMTTEDLSVDYACAGFFGTINGTVKNLTIENFDVKSSHYAGAIVGYSSGSASSVIENCKAINGTVTSEPELIGSGYDNGDKAGGIIGYASSKDKVIGCEVEGVSISAYRDLGGIAGAMAGTIQDCVVKDTTIYQNNKHDYKNGVTTIGKIVGRNIDATLSNNTDENVTIVEKVILVNNKADLLEIAQNVNNGVTRYLGSKVILTSDIDLAGENWTPIGNVTAYPSNTFAGTFDGNGHKIVNMVVVDNLENYAAAGFFGSLMGTVKNLTIEDFEIVSSHYAGGLVAYSSSTDCVIENCKVINGTITSTPEFLGSEYDNGDKVGGIIGYVVNGSVITGCTVEGVTIRAYRDLGGIAGACGGAITNCVVKNSYIYQDETNGYKGAGSIETFGAIYGRELGGLSESNNTSSNVVVESVSNN